MIRHSLGNEASRSLGVSAGVRVRVDVIRTKREKGRYICFLHLSPGFGHGPSLGTSLFVAIDKMTSSRSEAQASIQLFEALYQSLQICLSPDVRQQ